MSLVPWTPDPEPFGNASGFDRVALDVKVTIAALMGMTITFGHFVEDIQAEQEASTYRNERDDPLKSITVSHDGLSISGDYSSGRSIQGYRSSYWLDSMTPRTVVFDFRSLPWEQARKLAVRGPMLDVDLADGMVSKLFPADDELGVMRDVAEDYMRYAGTSVAEVRGE